MTIRTSITPCLWFDDGAEAAARHYIGIFPHSAMLRILRYPPDAARAHGMTAGAVLSVEFTLDGQHFTALNGGPGHPFTEAISFQVECDNQAELDQYWARLSEGGDLRAQRCGWLKDRYGLSWQIVPRVLPELLSRDATVANRVMNALMSMAKLDMAALERAAEG